MAEEFAQQIEQLYEQRKQEREARCFQASILPAWR
jgi:hypothetical protein